MSAHDHEHSQGSHGTMGSYMIGFGLSVLLTAIPFWLVMNQTFANPQVTAFVIMGFAMVQIIVHMIYFLHMNTRSEGGWSMMALLFTLVGTHGLHVTFGIVWLVTLMVQIGRKGLIEANRRRLTCLSMFWHFLDVIWIGVFTFVYLMGMLR